MKEWTPHSYFIRKSGSKSWPSSDPEDSPIDKFTCKLCGYVFEHEAFGTFLIGTPSFDEQIEFKMQRHIFAFHMKSPEAPDGCICHCDAETEPHSHQRSPK